MADVTTAAFSYSSMQDPVIKKFVDEVADQMKVEVVQTLSAQKDPARFKLATPPRIRVGQETEDSVGLVMKQAFSTMPAAKQQEALANITRPEVVSAKLKSDMAVNAIDLRSSRYALEQINTTTRFRFANRPFLQSLRTRTLEIMNQNESNSSPVTAAANKKLNFRIHAVKCIDETGLETLEWITHDNIDMGGTSINDKGVTSKIDTFRVSSHFDDGETVNYNPAKNLRSFALDSNYPKTFAVVLAIAEKDSDGGFFTYVDKLFKAVRQEINDILKKLAEGAQITLAAIFGERIGEILYSLATMVLSKLWDWITGWFKNYDDIFEAKAVTISVRSATATFNGSLTTGQRSLYYHGHGGQYLVKYSWEFEK